MINQNSKASTRPKIYILDAFHEAGIALARRHADVVCWPDPAIKNWPEEADGVMVRMTPITPGCCAGKHHTPATPTGCLWILMYCV